MALLEYNLTATGLADIERAYKTLEGYARQHNQNIRRIIGNDVTAPGRAPMARNPSAAAEQMYGPGRREFLKQQEILHRAEERSAKQRAKAHEKAEKDKTKTTQQEAKKREKLIEQELRNETRAQETAARKSRHLAEQISHAEAHALQRAQANKFQWGIRGGYGNMIGAGARIGAAGMALTGLAGGAIVANALHGSLKIGASASGLANQMVAAGAGPEAIAAQKAAIMAQAAKVRGASSLDAIGAARVFGGISGSYDMGLSMAQDFTKISLATDVGLEDIARLAGNAYMKIKQPGMSSEEARRQTLEAVRTFAGQGNIGAVEIKDLAQYGGRLTAAAAQFKGSRVENMAKMGTLAQVAVGSGSATDAAEATMAAARFASDLTEHAGDVAKLTVGGKAVNPYTDSSKTQFRGIDTLVADIMQGTGGDMSKMKDIFGERSYKMAQGFQQIYLDAERNQKGSGREAVMAKFAEFAKAAVSEKDVETRAAARLSDADMQLEMAFKDLNSTISTAFAPAFNELVPVIKDSVPVFAELLANSKVLLEAFTDMAKFVNKHFGSGLDTSKQSRSALDVAADGGRDPHQRLAAARKRFEQASADVDNAGFGENLGAALTGNDTPAMRRLKEADADVRAAAAEVDALTKNTRETAILTQNIIKLTTAFDHYRLPGGPTVPGGPLRDEYLPRGPNGSPPGFAE